MKDNSNIINFKGPGTDIATHLKNLRAMKSEIHEFNQLMAAITKKKYDALVDQGFTPEQALELCKNAPL